MEKNTLNSRARHSISVLAKNLRLYMVRSATAELTDRFPIIKIAFLTACIVATIWTEVDEVDVAVIIVIVDAEEKRIIDLVSVPSRLHRPGLLDLSHSQEPWLRRIVFSGSSFNRTCPGRSLRIEGRHCHCWSGRPPTRRHQQAESLWKALLS